MIKESKEQIAFNAFRYFVDSTRQHDAESITQSQIDAAFAKTMAAINSSERRKN